MPGRYVELNSGFMAVTGRICGFARNGLIAAALALTCLTAGYAEEPDIAGADRPNCRAPSMRRVTQRNQPFE